MYAIDVLENEHENILTLTNVMESMAISIMKSSKANPSDLEMVVEFIQKYSDYQHHNKEEKILFDYMLEHSGKVAEKLINNGMMVEHDLARLYVSNLKECINELQSGKDEDKLFIQTIAHLMEYANLLRRHAEKENVVAYPFAIRTLSDEILEKADFETRKFEEENKENRETQLKNLSILKAKYL